MLKLIELNEIKLKSEWFLNISFSKNLKNNLGQIPFH